MSSDNSYIICPNTKHGGKMHWLVCLKKCFPEFYKYLRRTEERK